MVEIQRFVYSPKVYIYVNTGGPVGDKYNPPNIVDLTNYTTAGSVNRVIDQVSTAEITIRNPGKKWTKPGNPTFRPMDAITIFMQRQKGYPVQVFTGYLDRTPYYHLYPGTCTLMASCTLKRLMHKYFDPALPYSFQFLASQGWRPTGAGGGMMNTLEERQNADDLSPQDIIDDSGFGKLLYTTLMEIGDWKTNEIYIEELPPNIAEKVGMIYRQFEDDNEEATKDFNTLLRKLIGTSKQGDGGGNENIDSRAKLYTGPLDRDFRRSTPGNFATETISFNDAAMLAEMVGLPGITYGQIAKGESELRPGADGGVEGTPGPPGFGLWQMTPGAQNADTVKKWESIGNYFNPWKNALMAKVLAGSGTGVSNYYGKKYLTDLNKHYTGPMPKSRLTEGKSNATGPGTGVGGGGATDSVEDAGGGGQGSGSDQIDISGGAKTIVDSAVAIAQQFGNNVFVVSDYRAGDPLDHGSNDGTKAARDIAVRGVDALVGPPHPNLDKAIVAIGRALGRNYESGTSGPFQSADNIQFEGYRVQLIWRTSKWGGHMGHIHIGARKGPGGTPGDGGNPGSGGGGGGGGSSTPDMEVTAKAAAFAAVFDWPSQAEQAEAIRLRGDKSLLNDKPLLPFIKQLTGASLRSFQSLPNGTFFAFYPDYFGEMGHRKPYWSIDDVEILDGAIELTDDGLVTHQYVVGDTRMTGIDTFTRLRTGGVVTVFNAFGTVAGTDGDPLVPQFDGKNGQRAALAFLQKYGPRPDYHEAPMIRSPYFEAFLAYQRFMLAWSKQFATNFTFTFMPELYPGGRVAFTNHGLQCYIDSVSHNWDYSNGFTTNAVLSAPSAFGDGNAKILAYSNGLVRETNAGQIALPTKTTEARD